MARRHIKEVVICLYEDMEYFERRRDMSKPLSRSMLSKLYRWPREVEVPLPFVMLTKISATELYDEHDELFDKFKIIKRLKEDELEEIRNGHVPFNEEDEEFSVFKGDE